MRSHNVAKFKSISTNRDYDDFKPNIKLDLPAEHGEDNNSSYL